MNTSKHLLPILTTSLIGLSACFFDHDTGGSNTQASSSSISSMGLSSSVLAVSSSSKISSSSVVVAPYTGTLIRGGYLDNFNASVLKGIVWSHFTHIYAMSLTPLGDGSIYRYASYGNIPLSPAIDNVPYFTDTILPLLKSMGIKVLVDVGGGGSESDSIGVICMDSIRRANMVNQLAEYVTGQRIDTAGNTYSTFSFDGLDIDWEFPTKAQGPCLTQMLGELRAKMPGKLITAAIQPATGYSFNNYDVPGLSQFDWLNVMTYDFGESYANQDNSSYGLATQAIKATVTAGVPISKMVFGVGLYGHSRISGSPTYFWNQAYNVDSLQKYFSPIDSQIAKANWVISNGARGIMYWEISEDIQGNPLSVCSIIDSTFKAAGR